MHLNTLYGTFGRKREVLDTFNIYNEDLEKYLLTKTIKNIIKIDDKKSTLITQTNIPTYILTKLNLTLNTDIKAKFNLVQSNVAIASAVTAYARVHMIPYKRDPNTLYTDTDSIFTLKPLNPENISPTELGYMKDEMCGNIIKEAYFLGVKQYGYQYEEDGKIIDQSTFSGVPKNMLNFEEVKHIHKGGTVHKTIPIRFFKSLTYLSITIKENLTLTLKRNNSKILKNNIYYPPNLVKGRLQKDNLYETLLTWLKTIHKIIRKE